METTIQKVVANSKPRNRAKMRPISRQGHSFPITTKPTKKAVRKSGIQPLAVMQDKINQALALMFGNAHDVHVSYASDGTVITITMRQNGNTATLTMSEDRKGGVQA